MTTCSVFRCKNGIWHVGLGLCQKHYTRRSRAIGKVVEKRTHPFHDWRYSTSRASYAIHAPSMVLDLKGKWHDVAFCSTKIRLSTRPVWMRPRTGHAPVRCGTCLLQLRRHGLID